ncbi:MAG: type I DNA topoisomerase [Patescibacteria group bacterium]
MSAARTRKKSDAKANTALVIVESPTKAKTITRFLGDGYVVLSSYGHVRDLPKSKIGIDVEHNFAPHYIVPLKAKPRVKELKIAAKKAGRIILATDEDREGEAIAWHLTEALGLSETKQPTERIVFHEITQKAIEEALAHPRAIDTRLVNAQQARRVLDRLVGYELSPFLWRKLMRGLSAGRVQSAAVRLIVGREEEITAFKPQEYWTIGGVFITNNGEKVIATLIKRNEEKLEKFSITNKTVADETLHALANARYAVAAVTKKELKKSPPTPFTTSTLQQDAWRKLRFSAKLTMMTAQQLYEGVELGAGGSTGLITYMRTDSLHVAESALAEARLAIVARFGENYALAIPRRFKTKSKGAQEAHEAVRPSDPARHPDDIKDHLTPQQWKLYNLIWRRFIATQMEHAIFDATAIDITTEGTADRCIFRANGIVKKFDGFLAAYPTKFEDTVLPVVVEGEPLTPETVDGTQHFTEPPPRYTEASLVKALEEYGIGRPSTYAPIISTIQARNYVEKNEQRRLQPTETGTKVDALLVQHFPQIVDVAFTAKMEEELDKVGEGETAWETVVGEFYKPFHENLEQKYKEVVKENMDEPTDQVCEKCGKPMVIKTGRFGRFLACTGFPECKTTKTIRKTTGITCPQCNEGEIIEKKTKKRRTFWGCSRYPDCDYASWTNPVKKKEEAEEMRTKEEQSPEESEE